jgi:hypothetical protein
VKWNVCFSLVRVGRILCDFSEHVISPNGFKTLVTLYINQPKTMIPNSLRDRAGSQISTECFMKILWAELKAVCSEEY